MRLFFKIILLGMLIAGCAINKTQYDDILHRETIYQVATISALQENVYDGTTTVSELKKRGDFGIGTFNALDGELIMLDGNVYRFGSDGSVKEMSNDSLTPFASVTFFEPDFSQDLPDMITFEEFKEKVEALLISINLPYAVRVDGIFTTMKTRAPYRQSKPYPRLIDALANQPEFDYHDVEGTLVGFYLPGYFKGINVPGWHLHFISADRKKAGHVLSFTLSRGVFSYDVSPNLLMALPEKGAFVDSNLGLDTSHELKTIEGSN